MSSANVGAEALRARAEALREAGAALRARPREEVWEQLARVLARWRDPDGPERRELERRLPEVTGYSPQVVREGLQRALACWSEEAWRALCHDELGAHGEAGAPLCAVLLAGEIPMPTLLGVLAPLATRAPVFVRSGSRDPLTAPLVARSIAAVDAQLGRCADVAAFAHDDLAALDAWLDADCVVATGGERALDAIAARLRADQHFVRHGHGVSLAMLGEDATRGVALEDAARGVALDTALWDQQGCLSPRAVFVAGGDEACTRAARALASALAEIEATLPRGRLDAESAARFAHECATAELRAVAGAGVGLFAGEAWAVVREPDATPRPDPLGRFLRVLPFAPDTLEAELAPWAPYLAGAALAAGPDRAALGARLKKLGATWVCEPGQLQAPPLAWPRDGHPPLASLLPPGK